MTQQLVFNLPASESAKRAGMRQAEGSGPGWNLHLLAAARGVARILARKNGEVTADDVVKHFQDSGIDLTAKIGNAMGSLFKGKEWEFTGKYVKSARVHAHANLLRVWRLKP